MTKMVYVHIDTTSNAVLSRSITTSDFTRGIIHQPKNLLLLDPSSDYGEYESHTGMKILRGSEAIGDFFNAINRGRVQEEIKWIDFNDNSMIKELTPLEISELLYFGHMKTHLHSPFFYKLQNNFVYFDLKDDLTRIYYRYLDEFYRILADKLTRIVLERINERRSFFRKATSVDKLDIELLRGLKGLFQEGILFCFEHTELVDKEYRIPIYIVEDAGLRKQESQYLEDMRVATLTYHTVKRTWKIDYEDEDLIFLPN
ncbi:hypothetical protein [Enterococcus mediterraneensis]|uniref:hypothetical protein n=1 Tax=Enterococcus mediterraneensis TaxID=2364791 RepID=UPI000F070550|nr:hypothetical protein [Enterococcus mediterraneensis]